MLKMLQKVFSHHSTTRCSFIIGRSGAVMQILAGSAANCQKIRNLELPNPNPTPFGRPDNACKCTKLYIPLQNILMGCLFFPQVKSSLQSGNVKTYMNFLSGSHIPLSEPHNFGVDRFKVENVKRHF